jgi:hypothetical protein
MSGVRLLTATDEESLDEREGLALPRESGKVG